LFNSIHAEPQCPKDAAKVGEVCVDENRNHQFTDPDHNGSNNAVIYKVATLACEAKGKRICSVDELMTACYKNVLEETGLSTQSGAHEWTNEHHLLGGSSEYSGRAYTMFGAPSSSSNYESTCRSIYSAFTYETLPGDGSSYINEFRCCQDLR
jgi:hypothetical protein